MPKTSDKVEIAKIKKLTKRFEKGFNNLDLDKMMEMYADNYYDINLKTSKQSNFERREYYKNFLENNHCYIRVIPSEIVISGQHAFVRGDIILKDNFDRQIKVLRYIEVWEKNGGGWKSIWGIDADLKPLE